MPRLKPHQQWIALVAVAIAATTFGLTVGQFQPAVSAPKDAQEVGHRTADDLSSAFRSVARDALPSIVSIETKGKPVAVTGINPFGENSPFRDLFKNDPRFKQFFENQQPEGQKHIPRGMGSGFIIDKSGVVMTNNHVVANADEVTIRLHDGREFIATEILTDPRSDVAVVKFPAPKDLQALQLGNSDQTEIADCVLAIGSPFGLDMSVTFGIISGKGRGPGIAEREDFLQTDAAINPGNSGGPLLNLRGEVVGINTAISTRSGGYDGVGFAIPINMAKWVSDQLLKSGVVHRAYLGVAIQEMSNDLAKAFKRNVNQGVIVSQVMPDSPAANANLKTGDVILKLDGKKVAGPRDLQGIVEQLAVDESYKMDLLRDGKEVTVDVTLREMPKEFSLTSAESSESATPDTNSREVGDLGIEVTQLNADSAKALGYSEETKGVVVSSVDDDSPAFEAGVRTGHIIRKVGSTEISTVDEFTKAISDLKDDQNVLLLVQSPRGTRFLVVPRKK